MVVEGGKLEGMDRLGEIAQTNHPQVVQAHVGCQPLTYQGLRGRREQGLPTPCHGQQPRAAIHRLAEIVTCAEVSRAGMQCHSHPKRGTGRPFFGTEEVLYLTRSL